MRQDQAVFDLDPFVVQQDSHRRSARRGAFVQDEVRLADNAHLFAGLRRDSYQTFGGHSSPRLGLVWQSGEATTLKFLYGTAFRAPNEYELHYAPYDYRPNPDLEPETIRTVEAIVERQLGGRLRLNASAFYNRIARLISFDSHEAVFQFRNAQDMGSRGVEVGIEARRGQFSGRASYSLQRTWDASTGAEITNSPRHMAKLNLAWPLVPGLGAGFDAQYTSARRTLAGDAVDGFVLANLTLRAPRLFGRIDASASVYNLLDRRYSDPGSEEHLQDAIPQSPRSFRVKLVVRL
jgi:iron complex outermembrane receptor protein